MSVGNDSRSSVRSYLAVIKETTWGTNPATGATGMSWLEPVSVSFKTDIVGKKLDALGNRGFSKRVQLDKTVTGSFEQYLHPQESVLFLACAMGGGIVTSSLTGAYTHSMSVGNLDTSPSSLTFNHRKGESHVFIYSGAKVNNLKITGDVGNVVKLSCDFICKDSTSGGTDISSSMSLSSVLPFTYIGGTYRYDKTEASLTSTVEEKIIGFELEISNALKSDSVSRGLGSNILQVLPPTKREIKFKINQRFDTSTTYDRFIQGTLGAAELIFTGESITAEYTHKLTIRLPKLYYNGGDPVVGGAGDVLKSEINFDVLLDNPNTSTGREVGLTVINNISAY